MFSLKKLFLTLCVFTLGYLSLSQAMSPEQKYAAASFAHDHPITTSFVPNFILFRCLSIYKKPSLQSSAFFAATTVFGTALAQFFGHDYLKTRNYQHHPKMYLPICSKECNLARTESFNQKAATFLNTAYNSFNKLWNNK